MNRAVEAFLAEARANRDRFLIIWALSDIQPRKEQERRYFETAVGDMLGADQPDMVVVAGDIVQWSDVPDDYTWYAGKRDRYTDRVFLRGGWNEIAGNHEQKNIEAYRSAIGHEGPYVVKCGPVCGLFMSDEALSPQQEIGPATLRWFSEKVEEEKDSFIFVVTHAHLLCSRLITLRRVDDTITKDAEERIRRVLDTGRVKLWISAHTHAPWWIQRPKTMGRTTFLNTGSIRKDLLGLFPVESRVIVIDTQTGAMVIRARLHEGGKYACLYDTFIPGGK